MYIRASTQLDKKTAWFKKGENRVTIGKNIPSQDLKKLAKVELFKNMVSEQIFDDKICQSRAFLTSVDVVFPSIIQQEFSGPDQELSYA